MKPKLRDYSIFNKFNFERKPVGVKFLILKPKGIQRLGKSLNICEMLKEAQSSSPFYVTKEDFQCIEPMILGMEDLEPVFVSGLVGEREGLYMEARANRKIYQYLPRLQKGSVRYVAFSPIDQLPFDPDVLVITANVSQAQTILRALGYSTGEMWSSKGTVVMGCAWLYIYPYLSGELNLTLPSFGMRARNLFPGELLPVSIPWDLLPSLINDLKDMKWVPHSYTIGREEHKKKVKRIVDTLRQETVSD